MVYSAELVYTPFITLIILIIVGITCSLILNKLYGVGLSASGFNPRLIYYPDSLYSQTLDGDPSWANRVIYVSSDKSNLQGVLSVNLFDPTRVPNGTLVTIFNSPGGPAGKDLNVFWSSPNKISGIGYTLRSECNATGKVWTVNVTLGRGQGVTCINQSRFGNRLANTISSGAPTQNAYYNCSPISDSLIPDLLPVELDPIDWAIWKYHPSQDSILCVSPFNNVGPTGTQKSYSNTGTTKNPNNALSTVPNNCENAANGGYYATIYVIGGDLNTAPVACNSKACACASDGGSLWCNNTL